MGQTDFVGFVARMDSAVAAAAVADAAAAAVVVVGAQTGLPPPAAVVVVGAQTGLPPPAAVAAEIGFAAIVVRTGPAPAPAPVAVAVPAAAAETDLQRYLQSCWSQSFQIGCPPLLLLLLLPNRTEELSQSRPEMTPALALAQEYYPRTRPTLQHLPERQPPPLHYPQTRPSLQNPQLQLVLGERVSARKSSCSSSRQRPPELKPLGFAPLLPPNSNHLGFC